MKLFFEHCLRFVVLIFLFPSCFIVILVNFGNLYQLFGLIMDVILSFFIAIFCSCDVKVIIRISVIFVVS